MRMRFPHARSCAACLGLGVEVRRRSDCNCGGRGSLRVSKKVARRATTPKPHYLFRPRLMRGTSTKEHWYGTAKTESYPILSEDLAFAGVISDPSGHTYHKTFILVRLPDFLWISLQPEWR